MFGIGFPELIVILVVALVIFGPGRLPEIGSSLGEGLRDFRKAFESHDEATDKTEKPANEKPPEDHDALKG
jgi:sec-independent protein translocase protein TatA